MSRKACSPQCRATCLLSLKSRLPGHESASSSASASSLASWACGPPAGDAFASVPPPALKEFTKDSIHFSMHRNTGLTNRSNNHLLKCECSDKEAANFFSALSCVAGSSITAWSWAVAIRSARSSMAIAASTEPATKDRINKMQRITMGRNVSQERCRTATKWKRRRATTRQTNADSAKPANNFALVHRSSSTFCESRACELNFATLRRKKHVPKMKNAMTATTQQMPWSTK
mmetsp:Transcript_58445/g.178220  ORF Transcript_58445/g.178220 Transcript_58445/m.178220 type:complete len:232 (-) Transcript_58445:382-1077(-)